MVEQSPEYNAVVETPFCALGILVADGLVQRIDFTQAPLKQPNCPLSKRAVFQIRAYLEDPQFRFDLPIAEAPTQFQGRVRQAMLAIAPGKVKTYGELSTLLASAPRAVGQACRHNPLPILVPCHRVVGSSGIGGFSGDARGGKVSFKEWLLHYEES